MQKGNVVGLIGALLILGSATLEGQARESRRSVVDNGRSIELVVVGTVEFTDDGRAVERLDPGSRLELTESGEGLPTRRVELCAAPDGSASRSFSVDGAPGTFDAPAERWFQETLRTLIRRTSSVAASSNSNASSSSSSSRAVEPNEGKPVR